MSKSKKHKPQNIETLFDETSLLRQSSRTTNRQPRGQRIILISQPTTPSHPEKRKEGETHHMITHSNEKIKKQLPTPLHLHLHRPTTLKRPSRPDDQRQVMRPQLRLRLRRVGVCEPRTRQDRAALDPRVEALFAEREALQCWEVVCYCGATGCGFILAREFLSSLFDGMRLVGFEGAAS